MVKQYKDVQHVGLSSREGVYEHLDFWRAQGEEEFVESTSNDGQEVVSLWPPRRAGAPSNARAFEAFPYLKMPDGAGRLYNTMQNYLQNAILERGAHRIICNVTKLQYSDGDGGLGTMIC